MHVDFAVLRQNVKIEDVAKDIGLKLTKTGAQYRAPCPVCQSGGDRAIVITPAKGLFYCFGACKKGGDVIALVSRVKDISLREAGVFLEQYSNSTSNGSPAPAPARAQAGFDAIKYANSLDPSHALLEPLGISPETLREWRAGYSSTGVLRGKLALPVTRDDEIVGYVGRTLKNDTPLLIFVNGFVPQDYIFGSDRLTEGGLQLVRDPLDVLRAHEAGIGNCVAFLTETISPIQLEQLASLMDRKKCDMLEF